MKRAIAFYHAGEVKPYVLKMVESVKKATDLHLVYFTLHNGHDIDGVDETIRKTYGAHDAYMLGKVGHAADYDCDELLLLDTDVIMHKDVQHVFNERFDVAMYPRADKKSDSKYNGGVIFTKNREFWRSCYRELLSLEPRNHMWMGDQIAENRMIHSGRFRVYDLPEKYNFVPENVSIGKNPSKQTHITHFKGLRKTWMGAKWP